MSEIFAPGSGIGLTGPTGPAGAAGSLANVRSLTDSLSLASGNLLNYAAVQVNYVTASDGTVPTQTGAGGGPSVVSPLMYCPAATRMISNSPIGTAGFGPGAWIQLLDANGNYIGNAADPGSYVLTPNNVFTLPGTQTYVRLTFLEGVSGWQGANTMVCASVSGTPTLPGSFQPFGLDTVADVNTKDAAVAATAQSNLLAALTVVPAQFAAAALPGGSLGTRNAFNWQAFIGNSTVNTDGSSSTGGGYDVSVVYCPGATSFISNLPIEVGSPNHNLCTYDAQGNFLALVTLSPVSGSGYFQIAGTVYTLPGDQTYVKFNTYNGHYGVTGFGNFCASKRDGVFYAGNSASPCPTSLTETNSSVPFAGFVSTTSCKATELGAIINAGGDSTGVLNAFLATASSANPIELVLDSNFYTTGLVISPNGFTTIRGLGAGTGITLAPGGVQDGIRIGAYLSSTGNSEGTIGGTPPSRNATNITLRDFSVFPNGQQNAAANQPVTGAIAHGTYGIILGNATNIIIDGLSVQDDCANYCVTLTNVANVVVSNSTFVTGGTIHDGIHIDGPSEKIRISNCYFATGDDAIALNAYEGWSGDITDVTITNCIFNNALTLMRGYGSQASDSTNLRKVSHVAVSNCVGSVSSCVASLGLTAGGCNNANVDEIESISFTNCDIAHTGSYAPFLLCCNVRSLSIHNHTHRPTSTASMIHAYGKYAEHILIDNLSVVRDDAANSAIGIVDVNGVGGGSVAKLTLRGLTVVDQTGSSYTAMPYVASVASALTELVIDSVDMDKFTALFDSNGTTNITTIKGGGVLGTGTALPDSVMANNSMYLSSTASGAPSLKVAGTAKRLTLT